MSRNETVPVEAAGIATAVEYEFQFVPTGFSESDRSMVPEPHSVSDPPGRVPHSSHVSGPFRLLTLLSNPRLMALKVLVVEAGAKVKSQDREAPVANPALTVITSVPLIAPVSFVKSPETTSAATTA